MTTPKSTGWTTVIVVMLVALAGAYRLVKLRSGPPSPGESAIDSAALSVAAHPGALYGRVTTLTGATYEGRLRFGRGEEAFWGDYFNGTKDENPWAAHAPVEQLKKRTRVKLFGVGLWNRERQINLNRPFMSRFGDIARIEADGFDVVVTLKSGAEFHLDRLAAGDIDDGVTVWDPDRGVVGLDTGQLRFVEFLSSAQTGAAPSRLYGTVRVGEERFTGFIQWDREKGAGLDMLEGHDGEQKVSFRFDTIRSIARHSDDSARVALHDGREIVLSGTRQVGEGNRGMYVDDLRFGRVLVSWQAFTRVDFGASDGGPAYDDFPPGGRLTGTVVTRDGRRLAGRLVYDLDESEVTETLDAPSAGVDYTIPFGLIAAIVLSNPESNENTHAHVTLHSGEELKLERAGDLSDGNVGMLIFSEDQSQPEFVPWSGVEQITFDHPAAMYPPIGARAPATTIIRRGL